MAAMLNRRTANWITQKADAVMRRLRLVKYRVLGVRIHGDAHLRKIRIPRNFHDIEIGRGAALDDGTVLIVSGEPGDAPKIRIGECCYINRYTIIDASFCVELGKGAMIGPNCYITDHDHGMRPGEPVATQPLEEAATRIGSDAWLGAATGSGGQ